MGCAIATVSVLHLVVFLVMERAVRATQNFTPPLMVYIVVGVALVIPMLVGHLCT